MSPRLYSICAVLWFFVTITHIGYAALTGVIAGEVTDNTGSGLPGVTITLSGPALQGNRQDFTNENGSFRFPELSPGTYSIKAEMDSMETVEHQNIIVKINTTTRHTITLELEKFTISTQVVAQPEIVDATSTTQAVIVDRSFTELLPGTQSYQDSMIMLGGMVGGDNPKVHGGTEMDNLYLLDGVDTTDTVTGTFASNINPDALEEVEVQTGGFQAEYGRSLGAIVNALTKSGGNEFNAIARLEYSNNQWEENSFYATTDPEEQEMWIPTLSLGGPIIRDMLWFFITTRYQNLSDSAKVISNPYDDPSHPGGSVDTSDEGWFPYAKLTFQPSISHKFVMKYNAEIRSIYGFDAGASVTPEATSDWEQGGPFYGFDWTWLLSQKTFITTQLAYHHGFLNYFPHGENLSQTGYFDAEDSIRWGAPEAYDYNNRDRYEATIALSHYRENWIKGSHDLKCGFEYQNLLLEDRHGIPGGERYSYNEYQAGLDSKRRGENYYFDEKTVQTGGKRVSVTGDYFSLYAQDGWEFSPNLMINFGLRTEAIQYQNDTGRVKTESFNTNAYTAKEGYQNNAGEFYVLAPRLGMAWTQGESKANKLFCYLGRYYDPMDLQLPDMFRESTPEYSVYRRRLADGTDRGDYDQRNYHPDWPDWELFDQTGGSANLNTLDHNLKPEYSDELQLGYERELVTNVSLSTVFTYRRTENIVEDVGVWYEYGLGTQQRTGRSFLAWDLPADYRDNADYSYELDHYWVTNPSDARRRYFGLELTLKAQTERLTILAAYTYARVKGTVYGSSPGSDGVTHFSYYYDTPELSQNLYGLLPYDIDHYFKINASYNFFPEKAYAFSLGTSYFYRNGYVYNRFTTDPTYGEPASLSEFGRGTYRLPAVSFMDLSIQKHFPFAQKKFGTVSIIFDINNLFSSEYLLQRTEEDKGERRPWTFDQNGVHSAPRSYTLSIKYEI